VAKSARKINDCATIICFEIHFICLGLLQPPEVYFRHLGTLYLVLPQRLYTHFSCFKLTSDTLSRNFKIFFYQLPSKYNRPHKKSARYKIFNLKRLTILCYIHMKRHFRDLRHFRIFCQINSDWISS
jgi:hypothetical protein